MTVIRAALTISFAAATLAATPALAASPFDGTWKADVKTAQLPKKPDVILLKDGVYSCTSCKPSLTTKADGAFHKVTQPYFDEVSIKVVDASTFDETDRLKGKIVYTSSVKVAPGGKTLAIHWTDSSAPDGKTIKGEVAQARVGAAPKGAHAVSGEWRTTSVGNISDAALTLSFKIAGGTVTLSTPTGYGYVAKVGGKPVPITGDSSGMVAAVAMPNPTTLVETDSRKGEVRSVVTFTAVPGGKALKVVSENKAQGTSTVYTVVRQ